MENPQVDLTAYGNIICCHIHLKQPIKSVGNDKLLISGIGIN